ncbi:MAG TPA: oxidoreductase [Acidimicrobiia bacterium]|nr:oxidoreductase [Acidimicrobiia bacterium]
MTETFTAFTAEKSDDGFRRGVTELTLDDLPEGDVVVDIEWSSVNYKDHLAATEKGRVARISPIVPGIDLAGTVRSSDAAGITPGDSVLVHGYDLGVAQHGGYAEVARVPSGWVVPLPDGLTAREAMIVGTAGYTAALSVLALLDHGVEPGGGTVLVTGATGGVGSMAVAMLAGLGFTVAASTGKVEAAPFLRGLGASEIIDREELTDVAKPLQSVRWAGAVDAVGGPTLAHVLATLAPGGAVAASGNVGGADLPTTVLPFILRGVALFGVDSAGTPIDRRRAVWARIASDLKPAGLDAMAQEVDLAHLEGALDEIGRGGVTGRYVVKL